MNVQVHHVIVHTPEQVTEIIRQALEIAAGSTADLTIHPAVFHEACVLLGARHTLAMAPQPSPIDLGALGLGNGRRS